MNKDQLPTHIEKFLSQFPDNAQSWDKATDEVRDMARWAKEHINELDMNLTEHEYEEKGYPALDFRIIKTPSEWNTKAKQYIRDAYNHMSERTRERYVEEITRLYELQS